jgi:hypothetical protein
MQRLISARGRLQLGAGGAKVTCGQREPTTNLTQYRAGCCPLQTGLKLDPDGERGNVGKLGPLDQRIHSEVQHRWDCKGCAALTGDINYRAHIGFGAHQLPAACPDCCAQ